MLDRLGLSRNLRIGLIVAVVLIVVAVLMNGNSGLLLSPGDPDLIVRGLSFSMGEVTPEWTEVTIQATIENIGASQKLPSTTLIYLGGSLRESRNVNTPALGSGSTAEVTGTFLVPTGVRIVNVISVADISAEISESTEDNNGYNEDFLIG